tara:strand:- start:47 stop:196 length:150 start_codon:yes stop_codon:yes gene_type:complete
MLGKTSHLPRMAVRPWFILDECVFFQKKNADQNSGKFLHPMTIRDNQRN